MSRVAIGIPVFNEEKYIAKTILSVLSQFEDSPDLEILISDNGSTDNSVREIEARLDLFPELSSSVRLTKHSTNIGAYPNFWHVYDETDSDYFLWVGAHDQISKGYVSLGSKCLDEHPSVSMFCGKHQAISHDDQVMDMAIEYDFSQENPAERYLRAIASLGNCYILHSVFRRSSLTGFDREKKSPSLDHVLISRWLWSGRLCQSRECSYLRRYFPADDREKKARSKRKVHGGNNVQFFDAYLSDLEGLASELPDQVKQMLIQKATELLTKRFGIPYVQSS